MSKRNVLNNEFTVGMTDLIEITYGFERFERLQKFESSYKRTNKMLISDGINHVKLQSIIVGELKKAGLKHRLKKIILKNVKVSDIIFYICESSTRYSCFYFVTNNKTRLSLYF